MWVVKKLPHKAATLYFTIIHLLNKVKENKIKINFLTTYAKSSNMLSVKLTEKNKNKMKTNANEEAERIALAIVKNTAHNKGIFFRPKDTVEDLKKMSEEIGISVIYLAYFIAREILGEIFWRCTGVKIQIEVFSQPGFNGYNAGAVALTLLKHDHDARKIARALKEESVRASQLPENLQRIFDEQVKYAGISSQELAIFYRQEIVPTVSASGSQTSSFTKEARGG